MPELDLDTITLESGSHHTSPGKRGCIMEWASYLADEPWSDRPECVSPVIGAFCRSWNDSLNDADRNRLLKPFLTRVLNTNTGIEDDKTRAWLALDWSIRTSTPTWLRLAGLNTEADALLTLERITDHATLALASDTLYAADSAARSAAYSAADSVAYSVARSVAYSVAYSAADSVARSAAYSAAYSVARSVAYSVARSAADSALAPTVAELQTSAADLLDRMIAVGQ